MKSRQDPYRKKMVALEIKLLNFHKLWDRARDKPPDGSFAMSAWLSGYRAAMRDLKGSK